jgi:hypothetical protein
MSSDGRQWLRRDARLVKMGIERGCRWTSFRKLDVVEGDDIHVILIT